MSVLNVFAKVFIPGKHCRKPECLCFVNNTGDMVSVGHELDQSCNSIMVPSGRNDGSCMTAFEEFNQAQFVFNVIFGERLYGIVFVVYEFTNV